MSHSSLAVSCWFLAEADRNWKPLNLLGLHRPLKIMVAQVNSALIRRMPPTNSLRLAISYWMTASSVPLPSSPSMMVPCQRESCVFSLNSLQNLVALFKCAFSCGWTSSSTRGLRQLKSLLKIPMLFFADTFISEEEHCVRRLFWLKLSHINCIPSDICIKTAPGVNDDFAHSGSCWFAGTYYPTPTDICHCSSWIQAIWGGAYPFLLGLS